MWIQTIIAGFQFFEDRASSVEGYSPIYATKERDNTPLLAFMGVLIVIALILMVYFLRKTT